MLSKLFIFGLLCSTVCPLSNAEPNEETANSTFVDQKIPCADQIEWIGNTTLEAKKQFSEYYSQFANNRIYEKNLVDVNSQLDRFNRLIAHSLEEYTIKLDKVLAAADNVTNQLNVCTEELGKFGIMSQNLSSLMQSTRPRVIELAKKLGLSPDTIESLNRSLSRMVMFTIDIGNHTVEHSFIKKGVKTIIDKPEEGGIIGHTEESASGIVEKHANTAPEGVPNPTTEASVYDEYEDAEDEKAFDDLINNRSPEIEKADKELLEREQHAELAEELRLAEEKQLLEREKIARIERIRTNELLRPSDVIKLLQ